MLCGVIQVTSMDSMHLDLKFQTGTFCLFSIIFTLTARCPAGKNQSRYTHTRVQILTLYFIRFMT